MFGFEVKIAVPQKEEEQNCKPIFISYSVAEISSLSIFTWMQFFPLVARLP